MSHTCWYKGRSQQEEQASWCPRASWNCAVSEMRCWCLGGQSSAHMDSSHTSSTLRNLQAGTGQVQFTFSSPISPGSPGGGGSGSGLPTSWVHWSMEMWRENMSHSWRHAWSLLVASECLRPPVLWDFKENSGFSAISPDTVFWKSSRSTRRPSAPFRASLWGSVADPGHISSWRLSYTNLASVPDIPWCGIWNGSWRERRWELEV